jgi:hypothetical protein
LDLSALHATPSYHHDGITSPTTAPAIAAPLGAILYRIQLEAGMPVRLNITMDEDIYRRLKRELPPKKISAFIEDAVRARLYPDRTTLDAAYEAARKEGWRAKLSSEWAVTETEGWPESAPRPRQSPKARGRRR